MPSTRFARVEILEVRREVLGEISLEDVRAEGYENHADFWRVWFDINGRLDLEEPVWVVRFRRALGEP